MKGSYVCAAVALICFNPNLASAYSYYASLAVGPVWGSSGQSQTLQLTPDIVKTYTASSSTQALVDGEFSFGLQQAWQRNVLGQLGLAVATTGNAALKGNIWDDADPAFNNYTYSYNLRHTHVAVKAKLLLDTCYGFIPWISASVGVGFNQASDYSNTPTISEAVTMPNFQKNTTTTFTYTLGAGLQYTLQEHWQAGIGYEFADWGRSQLDAAYGQSNGEGLSLSHFYTNGFLVNLTYISC